MDPFLGEIIMFGGNFAPRGWAFCDGQLLPISQYSALFSILGTTYGGDGRTTFALPDLRGRIPMHPGNGPGLRGHRLGEKGGQEEVTLTTSQIPSHNHTVVVRGSEEDPDTTDVNGSVLSTTPEFSNYYAGTPESSINLGGVACGNTGGNLSHSNIQPYNCVNFIIALQGVFPSRS